MEQPLPMRMSFVGNGLPASSSSGIGLLQPSPPALLALDDFSTDVGPSTNSQPPSTAGGFLETPSHSTSMGPIDHAGAANETRSQLGLSVCKDPPWD